MDIGGLGVPTSGESERDHSPPTPRGEHRTAAGPVRRWKPPTPSLRSETAEGDVRQHLECPVWHMCVHALRLPTDNRGGCMRCAPCAECVRVIAVRVMVCDGVCGVCECDGPAHLELLHSVLRRLRPPRVRRPLHLRLELRQQRRRRRRQKRRRRRQRRRWRRQRRRQRRWRWQRHSRSGGSHSRSSTSAGHDTHRASTT